MFTSGFGFRGVSEKSPRAEGRRRAKSTQKTGGTLGALHQRVCVLPRPVNGVERGIIIHTVCVGGGGDGESI